MQQLNVWIIRGIVSFFVFACIEICVLMKKSCFDGCSIPGGA